MINSLCHCELTEWAKKHLIPNTLVVPDGLNCCPGVEETDCEHEPNIARTDNGYDEFGVFKWVNIMISVSGDLKV